MLTFAGGGNLARSGCRATQRARMRLVGWCVSLAIILTTLSAAASGPPADPFKDCPVFEFGLHGSRAILSSGSDAEQRCNAMIPVGSVVLTGESPTEEYRLPSLDTVSPGQSIQLGRRLDAIILSRDRPPDQVFASFYRADNPTYDQPPFWSVACLGERILITTIETSCDVTVAYADGLVEFAMRAPIDPAVCNGESRVPLILQVEAIWLPEQVPGPGDPFGSDRQWFQAFVALCET
jgi:hypothetical protein